MRFLIKYATRGRPQWFAKTMQNILRTISGDDFLILVSVDDDDHTMKRVDFSVYRNTVVYWGHSGSKIAAINRDMDKVEDDPWEVVLVMSDDMYFTKHRWNKDMASLIKGRWGSSLDFFAHFNDGYVGERLTTMSILGRDYYKRDNYIYYPEYRSFSCDAEAMYVAQMRQRWHYFPQSLFLHQHPANSPQPNDHTYVVNSRHTDHDTRLYWSRLRAYFHEPVTPETPIPFKEFL